MCCLTLSLLGISGLYWNVNGIRYAGDGTQGSGLGQLRSPGGIFITTNDTLYVSDGGNYRILSFLPNATNGTVVAGMGGFGNGFDQFGGTMRGIFVDKNDNLYVADRSNDRIMLWPKNSKNGTIIAGNGTSGSSPNLLNTPFTMWVDSMSNIFINDFDGQRVIRWDSVTLNGSIVAGTTGASGKKMNEYEKYIELFLCIYH